MIFTVTSMYSFTVFFNEKPSYIKFLKPLFCFKIYFPPPPPSPFMHSIALPFFFFFRMFDQSFTIALLISKIIFVKF